MTLRDLEQGAVRAAWRRRCRGRDRACPDRTSGRPPADGGRPRASPRVHGGHHEWGGSQHTVARPLARDSPLGRPRPHRNAAAPSSCVLAGDESDSPVTGERSATPLGSPRHGDRDPARRARRRDRRRPRLRGPPVPRRHRARAASRGPRGDGVAVEEPAVEAPPVAEPDAVEAPPVRGPADVPRPPGQGPRHARRLPGFDPVPQGRRRDMGRAGGGPDPGRRRRRGHAGDPRRAAHDRQGRGDHRPRGAARPAQVPAQGPCWPPATAPCATSRARPTSGCSSASTASARPPHRQARRRGSPGQQGRLVAGDTFRAAAAEQLEVWAQRADAPSSGAKRGAIPPPSSSTPSIAPNQAAPISSSPIPPADSIPRPT